MNGRFEGSYLGASDRISPAAVMECKICWTPYDPAEGDEMRQVLPGTPFVTLPGDWKCPTCDAPKEQFMVREDPGAVPDPLAAWIADRKDALEADFREVWNAKMRDVPLVNKALRVQAVGFTAHEGRPLGVLVAPWFMNLVLLPAPGEDWSALTPGAKEIIAFPSGDYEFLHNRREMTGGYKACSLFSPMSDFATQMQAVEVAQAVMVALFDPENRAETDRAAEIRAAREAETIPPADDPAPTRRKVITAGLADESE
ncbi:[NiFe] hydrogenase assembly HybE family chaperone [Rhodovulum imhoffii]|uniref:[NiFe] hydrogenase assembly HybE family chaperone n=1 Tax=Rhodovulum imhoffii TaxID=365340 RepID=A0A2T5BS86_9RHOB|nr:[NiFe]-hydrogenase assembly chaperone HybE [Rhodovulum imhoffii]MBK5934746.1 rubredoxin [Rhodovulum imhoffii]PTN02170.1 [NiFe] hydrogenase assembly HybE family chaperone [Rhodovulum imhoffii]